MLTTTRGRGWAAVLALGLLVALGSAEEDPEAPEVTDCEVPKPNETFTRADQVKSDPICARFSALAIRICARFSVAFRSIFRSLSRPVHLHQHRGEQLQDHLDHPVYGGLLLLEQRPGVILSKFLFHFVLPLVFVESLGFQEWMSAVVMVCFIIWCLLVRQFPPFVACFSRAFVSFSCYFVSFFSFSSCGGAALRRAGDDRGRLLRPVAHHNLRLAGLEGARRGPHLPGARCVIAAISAAVLLGDFEHFLVLFLWSNREWRRGHVLRHRGGACWRDGSRRRGAAGRFNVRDVRGYGRGAAGRSRWGGQGVRCVLLT